MPSIRRPGNINHPRNIFNSIQAQKHTSCHSEDQMPYYAPASDEENLCLQLEKQGIKLIPSDEIVYVKKTVWFFLEPASHSLSVSLLIPFFPFFYQCYTIHSMTPFSCVSSTTQNCNYKHSPTIIFPFLSNLTFSLSLSTMHLFGLCLV